MSEALKGVVEGYSPKTGGIKIGDHWYNVSNKEKQIPKEGINRGDTVAFKWEEGKDDKGRTGKQIRTLVKVVEKAAPKKDFKGGKGGKGGGWGGKQDPNTQLSIVRQNALAHATAIVVATMKTNSDPEKAAAMALKLAQEVFEPYTNVAGNKPTGGKPAPKPAPKEEEEFEDPEEESFDEPEEFEDPEAGDSSGGEFEDDIPFMRLQNEYLF